MKSAYWICRKCGFKELIWRKYYVKCPICGSPLSIDYNKEFEPKGRGLHRYSSMLPFKPAKTRGEGSTPLVLEEEEGSKLLYKLEYLNPSGSFKDRGSILAISYAKTMGYKKVVEDTSGNTGISVTLYSRVFGLQPVIIMPHSAPQGKKKLIEMMGGSIVEAEDRGQAAALVSKFIDNDTFYVGHTWSYFYLLGSSTIAYEVYEDYGVPDYVIVPVGSGGLFLGLMSGFVFLYKKGLARKVPVPIVVEGYSVQPVFKAMYGYTMQGRDSSIADGIMVPNPPRLSEIINYLIEYKGRVILVDNAEIRNSMNELYNKGFIVEPTSATVYAAYKKASSIVRGSSVLLVLTGSGLKMVV